MKIDIQKFVINYPKDLGIPLTKSQIQGLTGLLNSIGNDPAIIDYRWAAYMLATVYHETAHTFQPVHEFGNRSYFIKRYGSQTAVGKGLGNDTPEDGAIYAGRGDIQVTGERNYELVESMVLLEYPGVVAKFEARTGRRFDLTVGDQPNDGNDPDNIMDPEISYCAMSGGMRHGLYTGVGLSRFIHEDICDYLNARKIINGLDCAEKIAGYAGLFDNLLQQCVVDYQNFIV